MKYSELTERIIKCAYRVYNKIGFGFLESVYENSMKIEMSKENIPYESQKEINVFYDDEVVGHFIADLIVDDKIIIELKSVRQLSKQHEVQLVNYLSATYKEIGLLINFGEHKVEVKRKYKEFTK